MASCDQEDEKNCREFTEHSSSNSYQLPFNDKWLVLWGGCKEIDNKYHLTVAEQKFAYDFVKVDSNGSYYKNKGDKLADYYSYGENVLAPADGTVVNVVDGIEDSPIGKPNAYFIPGNMVVISHENNEYSYLAHLKPSSIRVKQGEKVKSGQSIAKCGNSGNSTMPHIHFQLTNKPRFQDGDSIPITFHNYTSNFHPVKKGKPIKEEIVSN